MLVPAVVFASVPCLQRYIVNLFQSGRCKLGETKPELHAKILAVGRHSQEEYAQCYKKSLSRHLDLTESILAAICMSIFMSNPLRPAA